MVQGTSNESGMTLELVKQRKRIVTELVTRTGYPLSKHGILTEGLGYLCLLKKQKAQ